MESMTYRVLSLARQSAKQSVKNFALVFSKPPEGEVRARRRVYRGAVDVPDKGRTPWSDANL
jgi:hypothetical protein